MKKLSFLFTIVCIFCLHSCSNSEQDFVDQEDVENSLNRILTLKASTQEEDSKSGVSSTRLLLEETDQGTITVNWKEGDKINLCFVSEDGNIVRTVTDITVSNISANGKSGDFEIVIPEDINGTFNLYGVYGASFSEENNTALILPETVAGSKLSDVESISVMRFAAEGLTVDSSPKVTFKHIGSIFSVWVYNDTDTAVPLNKITLSSAAHGFNWLRNTSGRATFDIKNNTFINGAEGTDLVYTAPSGTTIAPGASLKLYRWIVPGEPIDLSDTSKRWDIKDINGKSYTEQMFARNFVPGKYYWLRVLYDGTRFTYIKAPSENSLASYWSFDGDANDSKGANNGTVFGNVTLTTDRKGNAGSAYQFDGSTGSYIKCEQPGIIGTTARSFSFWAKADALTGAEQTILSYGGPTTAGGSRFEISLSTGLIICDISISQVKKTFASIQNGNWNFYTIVFDGGAGKTLANNNGVRFYVNGILTNVINQSTQLTTTINTSSNYPIYFGVLKNDTEQRYFKGVIDDVRMYDKALIISEIKGLYYLDRQF